MSDTPFDFDIDTYWFVASPYERYPAGPSHAFRDVCRLTAPLLQAGIPAFSPIAHGHAIEYEGKAQMTVDLWHQVNFPILSQASGLVIAKLPGWESSRGMAKEIEHAESLGLRIVELDPEIPRKWNSKHK